jgi:hypothetical protein
MMVASLLDVVKVGVYDRMKAEGIWGGSSKLYNDKEKEVEQVMMIWFGKKII